MPALVKSTTGSDILAMAANIGNTLFRTESPDPESYLNGFIEKPWGHEYRIYCDYLFDVWKLCLHAGESTSMHCHVRKDTVLFCLAGHGTTNFIDDETVDLLPGRFVYIERGVFHRTKAASESDLHLVEVENPRNKFDLLRVGDDYGRVSNGYEPSATAHEALGPMRALGNAILYRTMDVSGRYSFSVGRLTPDHNDDPNMRAAVMLDIHHHLAGRISLLQPNRHDFARHAGSLSLLISEDPTATVVR